MSEENTGLTVGEQPAGAVEQQLKAQLSSMLGGMLEKSNERVIKTVFDAIEDASVPNRDDVVDITPPAERGVVLERGDGSPVTRLSSPTSHLYRNLSPKVREWRNDESDFWMAEWMRARHIPGSGPDHQRMRAAEIRLGQIFGYDAEKERELARADILQGTEGANFALSSGTGGPLLPRPIEALVMIERDRVAKMRRFASIYNLTRQQHQIPTAGSMTAAMVAEGSVAAQGEPALGAIPLVSRKGQVRAAASIEMVQDSAFNLVQIFSTRAGGALGVLEDDQFFKDGGGGAPNVSAILAPGTVVTLAGVGTDELTYAKVVEIYFTVPQQYRAAGVWLIAADVLQGLTGALDAANGRPFYLGLADAPAPITDDPSAEGTLLRRPVYEVPFTDGTIWFGDPRAAYAVGSRTGISTAVSEHARWTSDAIEWKFTQRFDGNNVDAGASAGALGATTFTP